MSACSEPDRYRPIVVVKGYRAKERRLHLPALDDWSVGTFAENLCGTETTTRADIPDKEFERQPYTSETRKK